MHLDCFVPLCRMIGQSNILSYRGSDWLVTQKIMHYSMCMLVLATVSLFVLLFVSSPCLKINL